MNNLFENNGNEETTNGNKLEHTTRLVAQATEVANRLLNVFATTTEENMPVIEGMVRDSMKSHDAMDKLLDELAVLNLEKVDYLRDISEEDQEKMIKSQNSKRSKAKGRLMTAENYKHMLIAAISENLVRMAAGKQKCGQSSVDDSRPFTEDELQNIANNPKEITRLVKNIQSKKHNYKHHKEFDETSEKWATILTIEQQLIDLRDGRTNLYKEKLYKIMVRIDEAGDLSLLKKDELRNVIDDIIWIVS